MISDNLFGIFKIHDSNYLSDRGEIHCSKYVEWLVMLGLERHHDAHNGDEGVQWVQNVDDDGPSWLWAD